MKVVIIEDELLSSRRLQRMLSDYNYEILANLVSVKSTIKWFKENKHPDILFLDVHLSDGLCFEIFKHVEIKSVIVFTTAFSEYSIKAFDYNSVSYLLKPINKEQLKKAIKKATVFSKNESELLVLKEAVQEYNISVFKNKFAVKLGKKIKLIDVDAVECFFSSNNITYLRSNEFNYILNSALIDLESELNPAVFFQISRKFIVNINAIKNIVSYSNSRLRLVLSSYNECEIIVSRERVKDFKKWIDGGA
ncbi:LytR/AlgR family response regulator transcription factor [Flavivirga jejuensis]|uniref:LytTR family DNA-binding domain-containing protein n=1 Tax=Flavivirga jejuensis TaxID=870487 RepID=A0ABT8WR33_9FLAO|nr:LytTR family DNA-binding domain-containing protein [Flavivirga jejuensis]MDO5975637.1 LytTR family DNA-binding domain-containing protein [Flavivirga jejuensis]